MTAPKPRTLVVLVVLVAEVVFFVMDPGRFPFAPRCVFHLLTGWDCPACGVQRAAHAFLHGRWAEAVRYNLFLVVSLPYLVLLVAERWFVRGPWRRRLHRVLYDRRLILAYFWMVVAWWVVRNVLGI